jgi:pimeloyl-ACP methyl ester carboxylesterase
MATIKTSDGTSLFYRDLGTGRPVVLIHGWPLNADMWEYQIGALVGHGLRCIAYDRRGFGRSDQPWSGYDYDRFADDLHDLIDALGLTDVTLVGFSMGGGEVARYLSRHGAGRIAKAVLVSSVVPFLLKTADHSEGVEKAIFDGMVDGLAADRPHFLADFGKNFFGAGLFNFSVSTELLSWAQWMALQASPKATIDCVRAFSETDFRPDLANFTMPTLVVHGDGDATVPIETAGMAAARLIPHAHLAVYEGAPHGLFFTEKDRLNADLLRFIDGPADFT